MSYNFKLFSLLSFFKSGETSEGSRLVAGRDLHLCIRFHVAVGGSGGNRGRDPIRREGGGGISVTVTMETKMNDLSFIGIGGGGRISAVEPAGARLGGFNNPRILGTGG